MSDSSGSSPRPASSHSTSSQRSIVSVTKSTCEDVEELTEESCYISEDIPGKGRGLVASRPVKRGELLFAESPIVTFPIDPFPTNSKIMVALSGRSREQQQQYFVLSNPFKEKKGILPALGIFLSCHLSFKCPTESSEEGEERGGVFLFASYFNSSCTPNVSRFWDVKQGMMAFRTLRDVLEGEELCINYGDVLGKREERMKELLAERGFECHCEACGVSGEESEKLVAESDERRATIARMYDEIGDCGNEPTLGMRKIKKGLRLLKEEGLVHYETSFCFDAFQFCVMVSDFVNAKLWIRRAYDVSLCTFGPDSETARMFKMYWANPKAHPLASSLPKCTLSGPD